MSKLSVFSLFASALYIFSIISPIASVRQAEVAAKKSITTASVTKAPALPSVSTLAPPSPCAGAALPAQQLASVGLLQGSQSFSWLSMMAKLAMASFVGYKYINQGSDAPLNWNTILVGGGLAAAAGYSVDCVFNKLALSDESGNSISWEDSMATAADGWWKNVLVLPLALCAASMASWFTKRVDNALTVTTKAVNNMAELKEILPTTGFFFEKPQDLPADETEAQKQEHQKQLENWQASQYKKKKILLSLLQSGKELFKEPEVQNLISQFTGAEKLEEPGENASEEEKKAYQEKLNEQKGKGSFWKKCSNYKNTLVQLWKVTKNT